MKNLEAYLMLLTMFGGPFIILAIKALFLSIFDSLMGRNSKKAPEAIKNIRIQQQIDRESHLEKSTIEKIDSNIKTSSDSLKNQGDLYERKVGKYLSDKGLFISYYGFRKGRRDGGIDLFAVSLEDLKIIYIQCKNWSKLELTVQKADEIHRKLLDNSQYISMHEYTAIINEAKISAFTSQYPLYSKEYFLCIPSTKIFDDDMKYYVSKQSDNYYIYDNKLKIVII